MKRVILLSFVALIASYVAAQDKFPNELRSLLRDSVNRFKNYRAGFKELRGTDSVFFSTMKFEGTRENDILVSKTHVMYIAEVGIAKNEKQGRKIVDEWRDKIQWITGGKFKMKEVKKTSWLVSLYTWNFERGEFTIAISLFPKGGKYNDPFIYLSISYYDLDAIMKDRGGDADKLLE